MSLREQLDADMKSALRTKDQLRLATIRLVKSAIKYRETEAGAKGPLDDAQILQVIVSETKKRRDSIAEYEKAGRADLAEKEKAELEILMGYLPAQLDEAELTKLVDEAIAEAGAASPRDMGKVMKLIGPKVQGRADGKTVAELVKQRLAK